MILDYWFWPELSDGTPILIDCSSTGIMTQAEKDTLAQELLDDYPDAVRVIEWEQHDTYPGIDGGPINVEIQRWERKTAQHEH